jgi:hypothetical protein
MATEKTVGKKIEQEKVERRTVGEKIEQTKVGLRIAILRVALTSYAEFFPNYFVENEEECASQLKSTYLAALNFSAECNDASPQSRVLHMLREDQILRDQKLKEQIKAEIHDLKIINACLKSPNILSEPTLPQEIAACSIEIKKFLKVLLIARQASRLEYILSMHELLAQQENQINMRRLMSGEQYHEKTEIDLTQDIQRIISEFLSNFTTLQSLKKIRAMVKTPEEEKKTQEVVNLLAQLQALTSVPNSVCDESLQDLAEKHPVLVEPTTTFLALKNGWAKPEAIYLTRAEGIDKLDKVVANTPWIFQLLIGYQLAKIKEKIYMAEDITMTSQLLKRSIEKMKKRKFLFVSYDSILNCACCKVIHQLLAELCQPYHAPVVKQTVNTATENLRQHHQGTSARARSR